MLLLWKEVGHDEPALNFPGEMAGGMGGETH